LSPFVIIVIVLAILLIGGVGGPYVNPGWQPGYGTGWYGNGLIGIILVVVLILLLTGYRF
jgi:hypothetical protein